MALYHVRLTPLARGSRNTVKALAYRAGTKLECQRTGQTFDYTKKPVQHVELLLPDDAPEWAKDLQKLLVKDRQQGVQQLSDLAEAAEKRCDARVYRDYEFALPRELSDEQNIAYAKEFVQDQMGKLGMTVLVNFHFDVNEETGERNPHCHAVMLTRGLTEKGLSEKKEREWETLKVLETWNEQVAAYGNFHLKLHGFEPSLDHRSYRERGIEQEPQPKLGRNIQEMERRAGQDVTSLNSKPVTDKGIAYQTVKLRNLYRIIKRPEIIFEMITKTQSTFMWGDVQKKLAQYVDDATLFQRLDAQLQNSKELVFLRMLEGDEKREEQRSQTQDIQQNRTVYTCKEMLKAEIKLVSLAESLRQKQTHQIDSLALEQALAKYNQKFELSGGLSPDQIQAIEHMVKPQQISCVVGYAGAGKTTALEVAKEIWEQSGYAVYGLAPTGRARENLSQNSFKSFTLHKFLKDYENGRCQFKASTVLVLDEGGMVNTQRFQQFLQAVDQLGVKAVIVGDGAQLQPVEAGPAFRLVTERVSYVRLEYIVRQKEPWQKEATLLFGQNKTREALEKYDEHGCFKVCAEKVADLDDLLQKQDLRGIVSLYNLSRRVTGNIYHEMIQDIQGRYCLEKDAWKYIATHVDYGLYCKWRGMRDTCAKSIHAHLDHCRPYLKELGVDPIKFALNFVDKELFRKEQIKEAERLAKEWQLPTLDPHQKQHICDPRAETKKQLVKDWYQSCPRESGDPLHPHKPRLMMSYSNSDVRYMNDQARFLLKQDGVVDKTEFIYTIHRMQDTDFGKQIVLKEERTLAKGDRLIFTRNDRGLGVSNGTLGTIVFLDQNNIKVRLDNTKEMVSFAPKLYPYFDQGWAATIHKNQGATADHVLLLTSFEMFRNLAYVGMTRHRLSVTLYASDIDFWKEEKIFDRLSRSQEKLSSLDYIDAQHVFKVMKEEDKFLRHFFDRLGNQLEAIKYVSKRAFEEVSISFFNNTLEYESPLHQVQTSILEEDRAREFFEDQRIDLSATQKSEIRDQMSEVGNQGTGLVLQGVLQAHPAHSSQDHSRLHHQADQVLAATTESKSPGKAANSLPQMLHQNEQSGKKPFDQPRRSSSRLSAHFQPISYYDREAVLKSLSVARVEQIFQTDIHQWVKVPKATRQGIYLRYGSSKGFVINLDEKTWYSHYKGEGGDIFSYVSLSKGISYGEAIQQIGQEIQAPQSIYLTPEEQARRYEAYQQEKEAQLQKDIAAGKVKTEKIYQQTKPIEGTLGEKYLSHHRGYFGAIPADIRFCESRYTPQGDTPALISFTRDKHGIITGYQEIYLDPTTGNKAQDLEVVKRSGGHCKGSAVRIQQGEGVTYIAEGIETALSIKAAGVQGEILSGFGRYVFKNTEPHNKVVVFCADYDGRGAQTHDALLKDQQALMDKGYTVHVVWPATEGENKIDFNDVLKTEGVEKIQQLLTHQLADLFKTRQNEPYELSFLKEENGDVEQKTQTRENLFPASSRPVIDREPGNSLEAATGIAGQAQEPLSLGEKQEPVSYIEQFKQEFAQKYPPHIVPSVDEWQKDLKQKTLRQPLSDEILSSLKLNQQDVIHRAKELFVSKEATAQQDLRTLATYVAQDAKLMMDVWFENKEIGDKIFAIDRLVKQQQNKVNVPAHLRSPETDQLSAGAVIYQISLNLWKCDHLKDEKLIQEAKGELSVLAKQTVKDAALMSKIQLENKEICQNIKDLAADKHFQQQERLQREEELQSNHAMSLEPDR